MTEHKNLFYEATNWFPIIEWHPRTDNPPRSGDYLVLGLKQYIPDHNGDPDAIWGIMIANYCSLGWSTKIKCWAQKPTLPNVYKKFLGKATHFEKVRW